MEEAVPRIIARLKLLRALKERAFQRQGAATIIMPTVENNLAGRRGFVEIGRQDHVALRRRILFVGGEYLPPAKTSLAR